MFQSGKLFKQNFYKRSYVISVRHTLKKRGKSDAANDRTPTSSHPN